MIKLSKKSLLSVFTHFFCYYITVNVLKLRTRIAITIISEENPEKNSHIISKVLDKLIWRMRFMKFSEYNW